LEGQDALSGDGLAELSRERPLPEDVGLFGSGIFGGQPRLPAPEPSTSGAGKPEEVCGCATLDSEVEPMFVASHYVSKQQAVAAELPQIIGNIHVAIGCCTLKRAGGSAIQVNVGDPVREGDLIETTHDGLIAI